MVFNINLKPSNIFVNEVGIVKIWDYIGNNFFKIFENDTSLDITDKGIE